MVEILGSAVSAMPHLLSEKFHVVHLTGGNLKCLKDPFILAPI